jgi:tetratricopeptide (TPR) repeat protein
MRWFLFALLLLAPVAAAAQSADPAHDAEARALFEAGAAAFDEGRFEEALERFRRSHELSGRPALLYNVGAAADRAGHDAEALEAYEAYVVGIPDADNRSYVEARVAVLRARLPAAAEAAASEDAPASSEPAPETPPADESRRASAPDPGLAIALFAGAGASGIAAVVTGALGLSIRGELDAACPMRTCADPALGSRAEEMTRYGLATDVLAGASLAFAAAGIIAALAMPGAPEDTVAVDPGSLRVRF